MNQLRFGQVDAVLAAQHQHHLISLLSVLNLVGSAAVEEVLVLALVLPLLTHLSISCLQMVMKALHHHCAVLCVFLVQDNAAAHQAAFFAHLKKATEHKVEVKKADLLTGLGCLHNVWMHDQPPIPIQMSCHCDGVENRVLPEELLLQAVNHVALKAHAHSPTSVILQHSCLHCCLSI